MYKALNNLYESVLIVEMEERIVDYISDHKDDVLPFDNIFGDKNRIVIPLNEDGMAGELLQALKSVKDFAKIDYDTDSIIRDIPLDPKYGGGKKEQKVGIGKAIASLKIPEETKKKYLNWYARYKEELRNAGEGSQYSLIISRAPIDIVRMSDHRNITSCHNRTGDYFQCAIQEAITGGAIAYLVYTDSLNDVSEDELQNADLFRDNDRDVRGIEPPQARLRIRRIESSYSGEEYAIPEIRVYGNTAVPGVYEAVRNFLQSKQNINPKKLKQDVEAYDHHLRGGSYEDNDMQDLVHKYFDVGPDDHDNQIVPRSYSINHKSADRNAEDDIEHHLDPGWEDEMQEIQDRYEHRIDHGSISYDYHDEGDSPYAIIQGDQSYDFSDLMISDDFEYQASYDELRGMKRGRNGEEWKVFIEGLEEIYSDERLDLTVAGFSADTDGSLSVYFFSDDEGMINESYQYDQFAREMLTCGQKHPDIQEAIKMLLIRTNFVTGDNNPYARYNEFMADEDYNERYENIHIDTEDNRLAMAASRVEILEPSGYFNDEDHIISKVVQNMVWMYDIKKVINNFVNELFDPPSAQPEDAQMQLPLQESVTKNELQFAVKGTVSMVQFTIYFSVENLTPNTMENIGFELMDFLDEYWLHICNAMKLLVFEYIQSYCLKMKVDPYILKAYKPHNYVQLKTVYGKYTR